MEYKINKETILKYNMKDEFPEVFETKLEVGKWYIVTNIKTGSLGFEGIGQYTKEKPQLGLLETDLGFNFIDVRGRIWRTNGNIRLATTKEVTEALKKEAVSRYKVGDYIKDMDGFYLGDCNMIFDNKSFVIDSDGSFCVKSTNSYWMPLMKSGKWAEIIPTITKKEAEYKLGCKIVD